MKKPNALKNYHKATNKLAEAFCEKYFDSKDYFWVGNEVGGVLCANHDYFFDAKDIATIMKLNPSFEKLDACYWETSVENPKINLKNCLKYGKLNN